MTTHGESHKTRPRQKGSVLIQNQKTKLSNFGLNDKNDKDIHEWQPMTSML